MMETYADLLKREKEKVEKKMTNYDMDEMRRRSERQADYDGCLGQTDEIKPHQTKIDEVNDIWTARRSDEDMTEKRAQFAQDLIDHESKVEIKLDDADLLHLAKAAHERDITLNQLCRSIIKGAFSDLDYRFEHQSQPSLLKEY